MKTHAQPQKASKATPTRPASASVPSRKIAADRNALGWILRVQPKLVVGPPNDVYEREADRVSDAVTAGKPAPPISRLPASGVPETSGLTPAPAVQRQEVEEEEEALQTLRVQRQAEEEEEELQTLPVQRQAEEEEEEVQTLPLQRKPEAEEEELQTLSLQRQPEEEEEMLQTRPDGSGKSAVGPDTAKTIRGNGPGNPLAPTTRSRLEQSLGADLSRVRVHEDAAANQAAKSLNAKAFTRGSDIWLGPGQSADDLRLMGHEAAHVVQQGAGEQVIQRDENTPGQPDQEQQTPVDPATLPLEVGRKVEDVITFDQIEVPAFKLADHRGGLYTGRRLRQKKGYVRNTQEGRDPAQRDLWKDTVLTETNEMKPALERKVREGRGGVEPEAGESFVFSGVTKHGATRYFIGDLDTVAKELTLPSWNRDGEGTDYHVDHIVELQLANWNDDSWGNTLANMELLEAGKNTSSGSTIKAAIDRKVQGFIDATDGQFGSTKAQVKADNHLEFETPVTGSDTSVTRNDYWTKEDVRRGEPADGVALSDMGELGGEGRVLVFPDAAGGQPKGFSWPGETVHPRNERNWLAPYVITSKQFNTEEGAEATETLGTLTFNIPETHEEWEPFADGDQSVTVHRMPGARYAGYVNKQSVRSKLHRTRKKGLSPIQIQTFDIPPEGGVYIAGQILPDIPIIQGTGIDFEVVGDEITLSKTFLIGDFHVPSPFEVRDSTLTLSLSTESGLGVDGRVDFGVQGLGEGYLGAGADMASGFSLEGGFSFDSDLFDPAEIEMRYENNRLSASGRLGIPEGRVRGIRSAEITASYENDRIEASGTARLAIPGVEEGNLSVSYAETEGMTLGGSFNLSSDVPGIRSGSVEAEVVRNPEGAYEISARGTAEPDIPGVDASLTVGYDNGAITVEGRAAYERGMLSGSIEVGATNRPLDAEGRPTDGEPLDQLRAYGGGSVTIRIAPWLEGTIGVNLLQNGEIEVSGSVGLPDALDIFPEKSFDKNIFSINLDIPIVGVAVAGQRIGIFATIGGGLDVEAGIGPGQLRELGLGVTYNPDHEDQTHVTGGARLVIPAHAGLRLFVRGSLGAGIPIVSASLGLEVGGQLGLEGAVEAGVQIDWTPATGLVLDAEGEIYVEPKFRFDITGFALVEADLLLTTIELYSERWELAAFEYGSNLRFGIRFPIHYEEGQPFDISPSDVEFDVPDIDTMALLSGLMDRIA